MIGETSYISAKDIPQIKYSFGGSSGVHNGEVVYLGSEGGSTAAAVWDIATGEMSKLRIEYLLKFQETLQSSLPERDIGTDSERLTLAKVARLVISLDEQEYRELIQKCDDKRSLATLLEYLRKTREINADANWPPEYGGVELRDNVFEALVRYEDKVHYRPRQLAEERHEYAHVALFQRYPNISWFMNLYARINYPGMVFDPLRVRLYNTLNVVAELNSMLEESSYLNDMRVAASLASMRTRTGRLEDSYFYTTLHRFFNPAEYRISNHVNPHLIARLILLFGIECVRQSDTGEISFDTDILFQGRVDELGQPTREGIIELGRRVFEAEKQVMNNPEDSDMQKIERIKQTAEGTFRPFLEYADKMLREIKAQEEEI